VSLALEILVFLFGVSVLYTIIAIIWQQAELRFYGEITPRLLDDFIAIVLAISLYFNIMKF
jgi:biotin transporter BioY